MGITRRELARRVAERTGIGVRDARELTSALLDELAEAILEEQHVELRGFGTFDLLWRRPRRIALNLPGDEAEPREIDGKWTVRFKPAQALAKRLRDDFEPAE